ncbi:MAG: pilus assembly protein TadG-related protein [Anaerolineales bacterium]
MKRAKRGQPFRHNPTSIKQAGQTTVFFTLILTGLLILTAVAIEVGRIVYARGEVGKAADAAALAAAARINVPEYRETGQVVFLPDVYSNAQDMASMNASYLAKRNIPVTVSDISIQGKKGWMKKKIMKEEIVTKTTLPIGFYVRPSATRMYGSLPPADAPDWEIWRQALQASDLKEIKLVEEILATGLTLREAGVAMVAITAPRKKNPA